jgi:hypothetical protein
MLVCLKSDGASDPGPSPQSSYSNQGESVRADWLRSDSGGTVGNLELPFGFQLAGQFGAFSERPYSITTGSDNNAMATSVIHLHTHPLQGIYSTRFGLLTRNTQVTMNGPNRPGVWN